MANVGRETAIDGSSFEGLKMEYQRCCTDGTLFRRGRSTWRYRSAPLSALDEDAFMSVPGGWAHEDLEGRATLVEGLLATGAKLEAGRFRLIARAVTVQGRRRRCQFW